MCNCDRCKYLRGEPFVDEERIKTINENQKILDRVTESIIRGRKASDIIKGTVDEMEKKQTEEE